MNEFSPEVSVPEEQPPVGADFNRFTTVEHFEPDRSEQYRDEPVLEDVPVANEGVREDEGELVGGYRALREDQLNALDMALASVGFGVEQMNEMLPNFDEEELAEVDTQVRLLFALPPSARKDAVSPLIKLFN